VVAYPNIAIDQSSHMLAEGVKDSERYMGSMSKGVPNRRDGIEWIRIILKERIVCRNDL
jgi:hypothetical protein